MGNIAHELDEATYDERPVEDPMELHDLVRLRTELSWADWKAHPRFKRDRVLCDAARRWGTPSSEAIPFGVLAELRGEAPSNDVPSAGMDEALTAALSADPVFAERCDEQHDAWIEAMDAAGPDEDFDTDETDCTDTDIPTGNARGA